MLLDLIRGPVQDRNTHDDQFAERPRQAAFMPKRRQILQPSRGNVKTVKHEMIEMQQTAAFGDDTFNERRSSGFSAFEYSILANVMSAVHCAAVRLDIIRALLTAGITFSAIRTMGRLARVGSRQSLPAYSNAPKSPTSSRKTKIESAAF